jgi:hypothetical protein
MRGFTDKCLLLFPRIDTYRDKVNSYYRNMANTANKLIKYFRENEIDTYAFTTDDVAILTNMNGIKWINPLIKEDAFFVKNNCRNMNTDFPNCTEYADALDKAKRSIPVAKGQAIEERFDDVIKRVRIATTEIIAYHNLIAHIHTTGQSAYRVTPKEGDKRCLLNIHNGNFTIKAFMGGLPQDPVLLLQRPYANQPVFLWNQEVSDELACNK